MTSCPSEEDLVLFVEDASRAARPGVPDCGDGVDAVADHLTECADCRRLVARSEAALRYALGGVADRERAAPVVARRSSTLRRLAPRIAAAAALVAAVATGAVVVTRRPAPDATDVASPAAPERPRTLDERLDDLIARADRIAASVPEPESHAGLAALAAAEARFDLGLETGEARLRDVVERFPGTPEAREARARLASLGGGR